MTILSADREADDYDLQFSDFICDTKVAEEYVVDISSLGALVYSNNVFLAEST